MEEYTMTYEKALEVLESCTDETMKAAAQTACKALRAEIGRSHRYARLFKSKKAVWHTLDEKADLSKSILMYDVDGNFMSPPVRCPFSFDDFFVKTMNKKYGANYQMWAYMDDIKPKVEE